MSECWSRGEVDDSSIIGRDDVACGEQEESHICDSCRMRDFGHVFAVINGDELTDERSARNDTSEER